ncbi:MAG: carbohydrate kinase family protein [Clostridiales bacterium]|jgi:sugar/nucleoside kinase (ribokinase family)|nr:carbohydrate kinase family protein [Clostridiales bacterium]
MTGRGAGRGGAEAGNEVLCVGIVNLNVVFKPVPADLMSRDVALAESIEYLCGGDAVNQAMVLSKLGRRAAVAGKLGDDAVGRMILEQLSESGVDISGLRVSRARASGLCAVMVRPDGSRNFLAFRGGTEDYGPEDFSGALLSGVRAVSIGSMFALKRLDGGGVENILRAARKRGALTFADMKSDTYGLGYRGIRRVMPQLSYFLPSRDEAAYLSGEREPRAMAERFLADGAANVVIKLGDGGAYVRGAEEPEGFCCAAYDAPVVDTTGAGDNFVAGFISATLDGKGLRESAEFANAAASVSVGVLGAHGGVRSREQVELFMRSAAKRGAHG